MKKIFLSFLLAAQAFGAVNSYSSRVNLAPVTAIIERIVGSSLVITNSGGSSLRGASVVSVVPQVWVTNTGSSTVSFAASPPSLIGGGSIFVAGQTNLFGGSLTLPQQILFHAPSIYPQYGSSIQVGTQTYSVSAVVQLSDGTILYPTAATITVLPMPLPASQVSGWH